MKRNQITQPNININIDKETPTETIEKLLQVLTTKKQKQEAPAKQKRVDLFLSDDDIEKLHDQYEDLYKQVKDSIDLTPAQTDKECETLSKKYDFKVEELSLSREAEYLTSLAEIEARNKEQIPWRRCWLWRLIFQPTTNRAQDIIERRAKLDAEEKFSKEEKELDDREAKLYAATGKTLSRRKREKLLKKYLHIKQLLEEDSAGAADDAQGAAEQEQPAAVENSNATSSEAPALYTAPTEEPPELPPRQPRTMCSTT